MEHKSLAERANVWYATVGRGKRIHYSPINDETLCGKFIGEYLKVEHVVELLDHKGYDWCTPCGTAAEKRAEARLAAEAERDERLDALAASVTQQHAEVDAHLAEIRQIAAEVDEFAAEVTAWGAEVDAACAPAEDAADAEQIEAEQRLVEGVVVEHAGTTEGSTPSNATHPNVVAAREALAGLAAAPLTDHHDVTEPTEGERDVRGYMIGPREGRRVAVYWLEGGRIVRRDDSWHGPSLDCLADRMTRRGWAVEKMPRSSQCVFAHRPVEDTPPAEAQPAAPAELPAGADLDDTCLHGNRPRPDVSGDPITWCARKQPNQSAGVWNDEGCALAVDCCVEAANDCAQYNIEAEAPAGDPKFEWALMCTEHEEQMLDSCEECNAVPTEDRCKECAGKGCHWCHWTGEQQPEQAVDEAETVEHSAAGGTWRGGWIASTPPPVGDELFDLDQGEGEQGALFE
ncbi:hypothetical protein [Streptomyces sioyaensis]|uniref:hypothetical protein n=1 Tax=Streptomyces sioyaensis TaxID=67364 RepID=UPI003D75B485